MNFNSLILILFIFIALPQTKEQDQKPDLAAILKEKNNDYFNLSKLGKLSYDELTNLYKRAESADYKIGVIYALNNLGIYHRKKDNFKKALEHHNKALKICKKNAFIDAQLVCLNLLGVTYRRQDDIRNALGYYQSVISLSKRINKKSLQNKISISIAENSLGNIYISLQQYELAIHQFKKALKTQDNTKNIKGLAINYQNIGKAYEKLELYDKALPNYKASLKYNKQLNSNFGKVICINNIASISIKTGEYTKALNILETIYPIAFTLNNKYHATTLSNLGWAKLKLKNYDDALENLTQALHIVETYSKDVSLKINILRHLAELYESQDDIKKSYEYYKKAIAIEKKTVTQRNNIYINNLISKQDLQSKLNAFNELQNETKIKTLQSASNKNILVITMITIALLTTILFSVYKQHMLKKDRKILLLEQQALQTQMNPHFVFNALNSIKLYIINNEQKNAAHYLNKFSKLIRNILEVSKVKEVSLKEELSTMALYMTIENIRFDNSIAYIENIHPDLNTDTIKLPPLVLQPFLENAIWHGLSSKEGEKEIIVSAKKTAPGLVEITITDNGIGRNESFKIKKNKKKPSKRKSVGIDLTKDRLTTFCAEYINEFSLQYIDLKDNDEKPIGTQVVIRIPLS